MGIGNDIAPKAKPKKEKPKPKIEKKEAKINLEPGEVEVGVNVRNKKTDDLYSDFLSDWDHNIDRSEDHHHHDHGHPEDIEDDTIKPKDDPKEKEDTDKGGGLFKWILLFFVVLIAIIVWQNYSKITAVFNFSSEDKKTKTEDEIAYYDNSTTDYTTPTETTDTATTEVDTDTAVTPPVIDKSTIAIQVLNGNGTSGTGAIAKQVLVDAGFTVASTTNAKRYTYTTSIVYYKSGKEAEAKLVNEALSGYSTELVNEDSVMGVYDVVVVIGAS